MADDKYEVLLDFVSDTAAAEKGTDNLIAGIDKTTEALEKQEKATKNTAGAWDALKRAKGSSADLQAAIAASNKAAGELLRKQKELRAERERAQNVTVQADIQANIQQQAEKKAERLIAKEAERVALMEKERVEAEELVKVQAEMQKSFAESLETRKQEVSESEKLLEIARKRKAIEGIDPSTGGVSTASGSDVFVQEAESLTLAAEQMGVQFKQTFSELVEGGKTGEEAIASLKNELKDLFLQTEAGQDMLDRQRLRNATVTARVLRSQAAIIRDQLGDTRRQIGYIKQVGQGLEGISKLGLGVGVGIVGGAFAFASKYVRDAKESTKVTLQWKAAQESMARSSARVGEVVATQALPLLIRAATIAEKTAQFVERNPELVRTALNVGLVTAGVSVLGLMVSKGIKLYADTAYLATVPIQLKAAQLQSAAAAEQLIAAKLRAKSLGVDIAGGVPGGKAGGGLLAGSSPILGTILAVLGGAVVGAKINDLITKATGQGAYTNQFATVGARGLGRSVFQPIAEGLGM
ncbi:MAG: hypothetical protein ABIO63_04145, partial [Casimicrobiaceae bacterium]